MRKASILYIVLCCAMIVSSCGSKTSMKLDSVESIVEQKPDSAFAMLDEMESASTNMSEEERMRMSMLKEDALYRLDSLSDSDKQLLEAADYFDRKGDSNHAARSLYLAGMINAGHDDYATAIVRYLQALDQLSETGNYKLKALVKRAIADAYEVLMDWSSCKNYRVYSLNDFKRGGEDVYAGYAYVDLARANHVLSEYDEGIKNAKAAYNMAEQRGDTNLMINAMNIEAICRFEQGDYEKCLGLISDIADIDSTRVDNVLTKYEGLCYLGENRIDEASSLAKDLLKSDTLSHTLVCNLYYAQHRYKEAFDMLLKDLKRQNNLVDKLWQRNFENVVSSYYDARQQVSKAEIRKQRYLNVTLIICGAIILLIVAMLAVFYYNRYKRKISASVAEASSLRATLTEKESVFDELSRIGMDLEKRKAEVERNGNRLIQAETDLQNTIRRLEEADKKLEMRDRNLRETEDRMQKIVAERNNTVRLLLTEKFAEISVLCDKYYRLPSGSSQKIDAYKELEGKVGKVRNDTRLRKEFENTVNNHFDGLMKRLRMDYPMLSDQEYLLFLYSVLQFSTGAICVMLGIKPETLYNRRSSLRKKLLKYNKEAAQTYCVFLK